MAADPTQTKGRGSKVNERLEQRQSILVADQVSKTLGHQLVLKDVNLAVRMGECFGIIGPNGSGKSTLIKLLSGADTPDSGWITFRSQQLSAYSKKQLARSIAVLQQEALPPIGFTVREVVEMGRYPYQNWLGEEQTDVEPIISGILSELDLTQLSSRPIERLSGGERQRVALAKAAAQQPELLMLDEPTTYLDIGYQQQMMEYIRRWQGRNGMTVIAVLHDLNLAALYCDRIMVLHQGRVVETGTPGEVLSADLLEQVYGVRPTIVKHPSHGVPQILLQGSMEPVRRIERTEGAG
jgi:iron complex transport system ATP-binding protein